MKIMGRCQGKKCPLKGVKCIRIYVCDAVDRGYCIALEGEIDRRLVKITGLHRVKC
jgi:hypothetical protein